MKKLRSPGVPQPERKLTADIAQALGGAEVRAEVRIESARGIGPSLELEVDETRDVLELEFEGGLRQFIRYDQFVKDYGLQTSRAAGDVLEMPVRLSRGTATRGLASDLILQAFRVVRVPLGEKAALKVAEHFEKSLSPGLHRWAAVGLEPDPIDKLKPLPIDRPVLIFLHGTASSAVGSFGGLTETQRETWTKLQTTYAGQVYAFEHPTLSLSPIDNVNELLEVLPGGARLHLVSHSRGGLLGELLCRAQVRRGQGESNLPFDERELEQFADQSYKTQRAALEKLNDLLRQKQPRVERFVRVACPAAGTVLASDRLDTYFSVLVNVLGFATGLQSSVTYDFLTSLAMAAARERTNPRTLPGIEAMVPGSPLVKVLNRPGVEVPADLSVIAGDIQGDGLWQRLKVLATDLFYWQDHDLVVHTAAMYAGAKRVGGARYFFDKGPHVSHFNYFRNRGSAEKLLAGLTRKDGDAGGYKDLVPGETPSDRPSADSSRARELTPAETMGRGGPSALKGVVYVIPGIMGSELAVRGKRIWLDMVQLARGGIADLAIDRHDIEATGVIRRAYGQLVQHLALSYEVIVFPYDWRRSLLDESRRFGGVVQARLQSLTASLPVHIVAHSMGGLLARAMIAQCDRVWQQLKASQGRLVMLGTPNGGSHTISQVLLGREAVLRNLARLDFAHDRREVLDVVRRFRGLLELLPAPTRDEDYFRLKTWQDLHREFGDDWLLPDEADLKSAHELRRLLDNPQTIDPDCMYYVAGKAAATPTAIRIDRESKGDERIVVEATAEGDGRVPWSTGLLPGVKTWYAAAEHGDLANHPPAFPALVELLERGDTRLLPNRPSVPRGSTSAFLLPRQDSPCYPTEETLENDALGSSATPEPPEKQRLIKVRITHGDLRYARHPVLLGHYQNDSIVGAERVLDKALGGKLQARRQLGLYSGPVETASVVLDAKANPPGAIVVGLGPVGGLTPGDLRRTIARGLVSYALDLVEREPLAGYRALRVSLLLVGSGEGGVTLRDSVAAILEGAYEANRGLRRALPSRVGVDELELLEFDLDRAVRASRVLEKMSRERDYGSRFDLSNWRVAEGKGGTRRIAYEDDPAWWTRLQVSERAEDGALQFVALTDRARAESFLLPTQRASLDALLQDAVRSTQGNDQLSRTLFELLIPNQLKSEAPRDRRLMLIVDKRSARYPWELLQDGTDPESEPLAVRSGLIRQMQTWTFRELGVPAAGRRALVVGDPPTTSFIPLDGAKDEAEAVSHLLETHGFEVEPVIRKGFRTTLEKLFAHQYRVLHLAGHGVYEHPLPDAGQAARCGSVEDCARQASARDNPPRTVTGMVLADDVFLTPALIQQMRVVPELVFINCCHLGREEGQLTPAPPASFHQLAANLGTQLIEMGARAVVCAGWAVEDEPAKQFASAFYQAMLAGSSYGEAVTRARAETWRDHKGSNTWGAYQCYGDPDYRLVQLGRHDDGPKKLVLSVVEEAVFELENIARQARQDSESRSEVWQAQLKELVEDLPAEWHQMPRLLEALGRAYGEVGNFEEAVGYYQRACRNEDAGFSVKMLEQAANLRTRWAVHLWSNSRSTASRARQALQTVTRAIHDLELLLQLGATKERLSLLGSAFKRKALMVSGKDRTRALAEMQSRYQSAHELALDRDQRTDYYPALNWLTARVLIAIREGSPKKLGDVPDWLDRVQNDLVAEGTGPSRDFFWAIARIDTDLVRHLLQRNPESEVERLVRRYQQEIWLASVRELRTVLEHLDFVTEMLVGDLPKGRSARDKQRQVLGSSVRAIRQGLEPGPS